MSRTAAVLTALLALTLGCSAATPVGTGPATPATPSRSTPVRTQGTGADGQVTKLLVFIEENHSLSQMRTEMPYAFGLAQRYGYATNFTAIGHPSLPNYIAIASGSTSGITDDDGPAANPVSGPSVFGQAIAAGRTAAVYADGMPHNCATEDGGSHYAVKHNPWAYFTDERSSCERYDVPLDRFAAAVTGGTLPNAGMVIPNLCNDAHDCPLATADSWFSQQMSEVFAGPDWTSGRLAVVLTGDEDDSSEANKVLTVVIHRSQRGNVVTSPLTHYSLSRLFSEVTGTSLLGQAQDATSMATEFGLPLTP